MLKRVRSILDVISNLGFSENAVSDVARTLQLTFEEFFALLILMQYYFYQDSYLSPVFFVFYSRHWERIAKQYPNDDRDQRTQLIKINTAILAGDLKNETDLEMVTKNAIRELFDK